MKYAVSTKYAPNFEHLVLKTKVCRCFCIGYMSKYFSGVVYVFLSEFLFISAAPQLACFGAVWLVLSCLWLIPCCHEVQISDSTIAVVVRALTLEFLKGSARCFCNSELNSKIVKWSKIVNIKTKKTASCSDILWVQFPHQKKERKKRWFLFPGKHHN